MKLEKDGWEVGRIKIDRIGWEVRYRSYESMRNMSGKWEVKG